MFLYRNKNMKIDVKDSLVKDEVEEVIRELKNELKKEPTEEKEYKIKPLNQRIQEDIKFLSSCVRPEENEEVVVMETMINRGYNKFVLEYPTILRENKPNFVDIGYLADGLMAKAGKDFSILKLGAESKFLGEEFLKSVRIKSDRKARFFLENAISSSNSHYSLAIFLGHTLLSPGKVSKVVETEKVDEKNRRVINVYSLDFRGKDDTLIYGTAISTLKYLNIRAKIDLIF